MLLLLLLLLLLLALALPGALMLNSLSSCPAREEEDYEPDTELVG